jgi:hypothetical protein
MLGDSVAVLPQIVTGTSILTVNTGLVKVVAKWEDDSDSSSSSTIISENRIDF